ncbi:E-selectin [Halotydeus destructor]|nr:E-selectin [Halotydeus destructor]
MCVNLAVQCPELSLSSNIQLVNGCQNNAGYQCVFRCVTGTLMGPSSIYCQVNGQWSGLVPSCSTPATTGAPPPCAQLTAPSNGNFIGTCSPVLGSNCQIQCNQGFNLAGTNSIQCTATGWSAPLPQCIQRINCPALSAPLNGGNSGMCAQSLPGQTCSFTCNTGFSLSGQATLTCGQAGTWSGQAPVCIATGCPAQNPPANGQISGQCIPGIANQVCIFNCFPGYRISGNRELTCQGGQWNGAPPTCVPDGCGTLVVPLGGFFTANGAVTLTPCPGLLGSICNLICSQGYAVQGSTTTRCQQVGNVNQWSPQPGTCIRTGSAAQVRSRRAVEREGTTRRPTCVVRKPGTAVKKG